MTTMVSQLELKRLLSSLTQQKLPVCIRYRTIGQLWYPNFLRVVKIDEGKSALFHDDTRNKLISLPDVSRIIQFELDSRFLQFEPNYHYQVADDATQVY